MSKRLCLAGILALSMTTGACAQFETSKESLTPAAPSPIPGGSSIGPLVGLWTPSSGVAAPDPSTCGNFTWEITSQSDTAIQGSFAGECGGGVTVSATVSGVLTNPTSVAIHVVGTGMIRGLGCPFTLDAIGTIFDNDNAIRIPYTGTTCFGPVSGTETLRKPTPPPPPPSEPPPPGENGHHVPPGGPLTDLRASQVIFATGDEFPHLLAPIGDVGQKMANAEEILLRCIWHLQHAGYQAARQRNPSGAMSLDKLTVILDDQRWHSYDVMTNFDIGGVSTRVIWIEVAPPNPIGSGGIPD